MVDFELIDLPVEAGLDLDRNVPLLAQWFPNLFAEGLVPINPARWPGYLIGSAMASDMPDFPDKLRNPFDNLVTVKEYLESSKSDVQWRDRFWDVTEKTFAINAACELGETPGSMAAGAAANKIADNYMNEMVETESSLRLTEKLNMRQYQINAMEKGVDANLVRGTGLNRQYVAKPYRGNILDRPPRGARPLWAYRHIWGSTWTPASWLDPTICRKSNICFMFSKTFTKS